LRGITAKLGTLGESTTVVLQEESMPMPRAVRFDHYGGVDVLQVVEVDRPVPGAGEVLVEVVAAGINPGEISIREGLLDKQWPATFPSVDILPRAEARGFLR